ncbi:MAG: GNAT family N-acetyltransferase [Pedobacter sp.]|nr:GNAT family N-acetyltransferase [Pedobacter sp.]
MENIVVVQASVECVARLQGIATRTFLEAFASSNAEESMSAYMEKAFSTEKLLSELNHVDSKFYFAIVDKEVIGYLKVNTGIAQTEPLDERALEIERIYVLAEYHGKKVGQILYEKALSVAEALNASYVWLGVWEENKKAIRFYEKNGFVAFDQHLFKLGDEEQTDILMKKLI